MFPQRNASRDGSASVKHQVLFKIKTKKDDASQTMKLHSLFFEIACAAVVPLAVLVLCLHLKW